MASNALTPLESAIASLEAQRAILGDAVVDAALKPLRDQLAVLTSPSPPSAAPSNPMGGERKLLTVMFADISGFTALSEKLDPEHVRSLMNACFDSLVPCVQAVQGTIDKFIGDAIMALFGAPVAYENHAERALRCALAMMDALAAFNTKNGTSLGLHIGINTGLAIAGGIGSHGQQQYSVIGDAVNLAARLEDASETGEILVGPSTYRLTAPLFEFEVRDPIRLKGKSEPVPIFRLLDVKAAPGSTRGIQGLRSPLIGREPEMEKLTFALDSLRTGQGGKLAIVGEAGVGKSRLLAEMRRTAPDMAWLEGRALSYTESISYSMARDMLVNLLGVDAQTDDVELAAALKGSTSRLFPENAAEITRYLSRLLDLPLDAESEADLRVLSAEILRVRMHQAYADYVRTRARQSPLVLVFEDLHWADPSSLDMLRSLYALTAQVPLLLVMAARPDEGASTAFLNEAVAADSRIDLHPLTREDSTDLLDSLLRIDNLPETIRQLILDKAEGNAFFLEEVLRALIDAGMIIVESDRAAAAPSITTLKAIDVPDTLQGVIAARIDRLPTEDKLTLQTASVIGRIFQHRVLEKLVAEHSVSKGLDDSLHQLRHREFIRLRSDLEYIFKHAVTQDVAYGSLLVERRRALHRVTAETIESLFPESLDELSGTLAYHYERAGSPEKAITYLMKAAERARATFANTEAIAYFRAAIEQAASFSAGEHVQERALLYENLAQVLTLIGRHEEARLSYESGLNHLSESDVVLRARILRRMAKTWEVQRLYDNALVCHADAEALLGSDPLIMAPAERDQWIDVCVDRTRLYYWKSQQEKLMEVVGQVRPVIEEYGSFDQRATLFSSLTLAGLRADLYNPSAETIHYSRLAAELSADISSWTDRAWNMFSYGFTLLWAGMLDESEAVLNDALSLTRRTGDVTTESRCMTYLTILFRKRKDVDRVRKYAHESIQVAKAGNMIEYVGMAYASLAWADVRQALWDQARDHFQRSLDSISGTMQIRMSPWVIYMPALRLSLHEDQIAQAVDHVRPVIASKIMRLPDEMVASIEQAIAAWERGDVDSARTHLVSSFEIAEREGFS